MLNTITIQDKLRVIEWLYPEKIGDNNMSTYDCTCGWVESDEWYAPYPLHDDSCPIQVRLVDEVTV